jgi:hypothetical protein
VTEAEFEAWQELAIKEYAGEIAESSGRRLDEALAVAKKQWPIFLPKGMDTERTWLLFILDERGERAGSLWIGPNPPVPAARLRVLDRDRRGRARTRTGSRGLYDSLGYRVVATQLTKVL